MAEYIYEIESDEDNESEIFIGWIRNHSQELVRCKDCIYHFYEKKYDVQYCSRKDYGYGWKDDDYCSMAVRKRNETD